MDCTLLTQIKAAFSSLWKCNPIDLDTIRITTPYASIGNLYVDLFIKKQGKKFVVTDGGLLHRQLLSGEQGMPDKKVFQGIVDAYVKSYEIKKAAHDEYPMFFKETEKQEMIANCVFEMADFARSYLSAISIGAAQSAESPDIVKERFERDAKKYLKQNYKQKEQLQFQVPIGPDGRKKKVSAVIYAKKKLNPVQFLSGGNFYYYKSNVNNAHQDYALLGGFDLIGEKLAIYDDTSDVYKEQTPLLHEYLNSMAEVLTHEPIPWSQRDRVREIVPIG